MQVTLAKIEHLMQSIDGNLKTSDFLVYHDQKVLKDMMDSITK